VRTVLAAAAGLLLAAAAAAQDPEKVPEAAEPGKVKPGQTALLQAPKKMRYFLRVPEGYDPKAGARLVVFLHGSNMNGLAYLRSFEAKKWAGDAILLCPNGNEGTDPYGANNFAMNSAHLVADATEQVKKAFKVNVAYCGGHSQGGFLTYSVILLFPALFQGAFPMAGDCWMQNEPNLFEDRPDVARTQREIPIAVIHGRDDPVVAFSQGQHAYGCFRASGWQKLRLFAPDGIGHMFMASPVEEALAWLDAMNGRADAAATATMAEAWSIAGEWGWVLAAARAPKSPVAALAKGAEAAAAAAAPAMKAALQGKPAEWVPQWLEFWRVHGATAAAKPLVSVYLDRRQKQAAAGRHLFAEAKSLFRQEKRAAGYATLEKLLAEAPCTYEAHYAIAWLAERK
jgi:predicted esterase